MVTNEEKDEEATSCNKDCNKKDQNSTERGKSDAHKSVAKELYRDKTPNGSKLKQCKKKKSKYGTHTKNILVQQFYLLRAVEVLIPWSHADGGDGCPTNQTI